MSMTMEQLYQERFDRYTTALRCGEPDRVPIRPFVAEFTARYAGYTCQQVTQDYRLAFEAVIRTCRDFDWDAAVANMVYVWGGIPQAIGARYYSIPGVGQDPDHGFQYLEPPEEQAWMLPEHYDALIADPTGFLYNVWLPRISTEVVAPGAPNTFGNNLAHIKGVFAMMSYFGAFPAQIQRMREECATVSAIAGILKAPFDILADKLRGYVGLCMDLAERPEQVKRACEALMPHLYHTALTSADPAKQVPIGLWMHRGCVPFISHEQFKELFWPTLKPIILELWKQGHQVLFYAEGKWLPHIPAFMELPEGSIVFHCDRDDVFEVSRIIKGRFCISGGISNHLLAFGRPEEVRALCRKICQTVAREGAYIADASAIVQNDAKIENMQAMTQAIREYGVY